MKYILASTSPRRKELFMKITDSFLCVSPTIDEELFKEYDISSYPLQLSKMKAYSVYNEHKDAIIISADTIVVLDNVILGKSSTDEEAFNMLKSLSNRTHFVLTGYTILYKDIEINNTVKTDVFMNNLSDQEITNYVKSGLYKGKAGSYGIQDSGHSLVKKIDGSYNNVVGFPIEEIIEDLNRFILK